MFDLVIAVDWSAASSPGPKAPAQRRAWSAAGSSTERADAVYHPTRAHAIDHLVAALTQHTRTALVGFDFAFGYPAAPQGPVMPTGRGLCAYFDARLNDAADDTNDRYELAAQLNDELAHRTGAPGPFWGTPNNHDDPRLPQKKPQSPLPEYRVVEAHLRSLGERPKSAWQLAYAGSVGSQVLTGLAAVHRLISHPRLAHRCRLWPFETDWSNQAIGPTGDSIVIAEIYPALARHRRADHDIEDARQVIAQRDLILAANDPAGLLEPTPSLTTEQSHTAQHHEGWILGVND